MATARRGLGNQGLLERLVFHGYGAVLLVLLLEVTVRNAVAVRPLAGDTNAFLKYISARIAQCPGDIRHQVLWRYPDQMEILGVRASAKGWRQPTGLLSERVPLMTSGGRGVTHEHVYLPKRKDALQTSADGMLNGEGLRGCRKHLFSERTGTEAML